MKSRMIIFGLFPLVISGPSFSQNCQTGIPSAGNPLCIPQDRENSPYYQGRVESAPIKVQWADRWGAIAVDNANSIIGVSVDQSIRQDAEKIALAECIQEGGAKCVVKKIYKNQCAALVWGLESYVITSASTKGYAEYLGKSECALKDYDCQTYYAACSFPVRIR